MRRWIFGAPLRKWYSQQARRLAKAPGAASVSGDGKSSSDNTVPAGRLRRLADKLGAVQGELAVFRAAARGERSARGTGLQSLRTRFSSSFHADDPVGARASGEAEAADGEGPSSQRASQSSQLQAVWRAVLEESARVVEAAQPVPSSNQKRDDIGLFLQQLVSDSIAAETIMVGEVCARTYLPDSPLAATVIISEVEEAGGAWLVKLNEALCKVSALHSKVRRGGPQPSAGATETQARPQGAVGAGEPGQPGAVAQRGKDLGQGHGYDGPVANATAHQPAGSAAVVLLDSGAQAGADSSPPFIPMQPGAPNQPLSPSNAITLTVREAAQMRFAALQDAAVDVRPESRVEEAVRQTQALDDRASTTTSEALARRERRAMLAAGVLPGGGGGSQFGGSQGDLAGSVISNPWIVLPGEDSTDGRSAITGSDFYGGSSAHGGSVVPTSHA